jgi:esterase/lipase superfamily enzyme
MVKLIRDFLILNHAGITIYEYLSDKTIQGELVGMLMSALDTFANQIDEGGLQNFELSDTRFSLLKKHSLIFVASSSQKVKEKNLLEELNHLTELFFEKYGIEIMKEWDGDTTCFREFDKIVERSVDDNVLDFLDGI